MLKNLRHHKNSEIKSDKRVAFGRARIDPLSLAQAVSILLESSREMRSLVAVTPNVDHILRLERDAEFRKCYDQADFVLCDGMPVLWATKLLGTPLPERVSGADLMPALCAAAADEGLSVAIIGGPPGSADLAAENLKAAYPKLIVAWTYCPNFGFEASPTETRKMCDILNASAVNIVFLGVGAPKQEKWILHNRAELRVGLIVGVGAAIEFSAGTLSRAPNWMQKTGLEWIYRTSQDPVRLGKRYAGNFYFICFFFRLAAGRLLKMRRGSDFDS